MLFRAVKDDEAERGTTFFLFGGSLGGVCTVFSHPRLALFETAFSTFLGGFFDGL
jgi:hypothetical protein